MDGQASESSGGSYGRFVRDRGGLTAPSRYVETHEEHPPTISFQDWFALHKNDIRGSLFSVKDFCTRLIELVDDDTTPSNNSSYESLRSIARLLNNEVEDARPLTAGTGNTSNQVDSQQLSQVVRKIRQFTESANGMLGEQKKYLVAHFFEDNRLFSPENTVAFDYIKANIFDFGPFEQYQKKLILIALNDFFDPDNKYSKSHYNTILDICQEWARCPGKEIHVIGHYADEDSTSFPSDELISLFDCMSNANNTEGVVRRLHSISPSLLSSEAREYLPHNIS